MSLYDIKIIFVDKNRDTADTVKEPFKDLLNVEVIRCDIAQIPYADCMVSPGNSYGLMDGGVDKTINLMLDDIQVRVKDVINSVYYGEQPVGTCFFLETDNQKYQYLAHVPTMMKPKDISKTLNAYLAFRALLAGILNHNKVNDKKITSILLTPFCTGAGEMDAEESARQMRLAYGFIDIGIDCSWENANMIDSIL